MKNWQTFKSFVIKNTNFLYKLWKLFRRCKNQDKIFFPNLIVNCGYCDSEAFNFKVLNIVELFGIVFKFNSFISFNL